MRKLFLFLFLSISFFTTAQSKIGLRGGMNFSQFVFRPEYSGDKKGAGTLLTRLNAGLQIEISLNDDDNWFIYTGPYYSGKGNRYRATRPISFDTMVTKLNYIELPVSIGYKFNEANANRFISGAGIFVGYGFKGKHITHRSTQPPKINLHKKDSRYKRIDAGFNIMAAYEINNQYGIRLDYSRSLFDISRHKWKETNNTFGFSFFWYLSNKNKIAD
jgi:hypothetical protein